MNTIILWLSVMMTALCLPSYAGGDRDCRDNTRAASGGTGEMNQNLAFKGHDRGKTMKLSIVYDNTAFRKDLQADWGFAALVEIRGRKILFDTGGNGDILLSNMKKLKIFPETIDDVFISHAH
ncbi:MAG: hypothetical protein R6U50_16345, partial [Desulfobacterales bacterium]